MNNDPITEISMAAKRLILAVIVSRNVLKSLLLACYVFLCAVILPIQPAGAQERDVSKANASPEEFMSMLKTSLSLSDDQEAKIKPIIEESIQKRREILRNSSHDRNTMRSQLQELSWTTDLKIVKILSDEQMKEYRKLQEEQNENAVNDDLRHEPTFRYGRLHDLE